MNCSSFTDLAKWSPLTKEFNLRVFINFTAGISNSFGFGGHNSVVVFAPFKP